MKIHCHTCGKLCADLIAGSFTRIGMVVLCAQCWEPEPIADKSAPANDEVVDKLRGIFGMKE